jgi:hypothetical protein
MNGRSFQGHIPAAGISANRQLPASGCTGLPNASSAAVHLHGIKSELVQGDGIIGEQRQLAGYSFKHLAFFSLHKICPSIAFKNSFFFLCDTSNFSLLAIITPPLNR